MTTPCRCVCHLEAGQLAAVISTHWLALWGIAVQVSAVESFHLTLLIPKPSGHFLSRHGSGEILALKDGGQKDM